MDPITHGLIGASLASCFSEKKDIRTAALIGGLSAMLPDLDVFFSAANDPLFNVEMHRQFTHALVFIPIGGLIAAIIFKLIFRKKFTFLQIFIWATLGFATAGITDAMTSYGTQLGWPFFTDRISWNIISVFDPFFTLGILLLLISSLIKRRRTIAFLGLIWMVLVWSFGITQHVKAGELAQELIQKRGHHATKRIVKPALGNQWIWGSRYMANDSVFADAFRITPFTSRTFEGESAPLFFIPEEKEFVNTVAYNDLQRFSALSDGYLIQSPSDSNFIGDARYALVPTSIKPLWGVVLDSSNQEKHLNFETRRDSAKQAGRALFRMLFGVE